MLPQPPKAGVAREGGGRGGGRRRRLARCPADRQGRAGALAEPSPGRESAVAGRGWPGPTFFSAAPARRPRTGASRPVESWARPEPAPGDALVLAAATPRPPSELGALCFNSRAPTARSAAAAAAAAQTPRVARPLAGARAAEGLDHSHLPLPRAEVVQRRGRKPERRPWGEPTRTEKAGHANEHRPFGHRAQRR